MKKFVLLLSCSLFAAGAANALNTTGHLDAVKEIFNREFQKMDTDKDGVISADEYMLYQFETLQKSLAEEAEKLETASPAVKDEKSTENKPIETVEKAEAPQAEKKPDLSTMSDTMATLNDMANFELPSEDESDPSDEVLSVSEEDSLKNILADMMKEEGLVEEENTEEAEKNKKQIETMMNTIKQTLPKKIDNITTWTDIITKENAIDYIYQADVDINKFSDAEKTALTENIEKVACLQAYAEMCSKIKPMFIDKGINMKIRYQDKNNTEISSCEFNNETCK